VISKFWTSLLFAAHLLCGLEPQPARAASLKLGTSNIEFATVAEGRHVLTNRDEFIHALSPFDRSARLKTDRTVSETEFLQFIARSVLDWTPEEKQSVTSALSALEKKLAPWHLPFPPTILLIKTSGLEEGGAAYTRQNAIILPKKEAAPNARGLEDKIAHELFHVLSRHNPALREKLYGVIGFSRINEIVYPDSIRERRITNPDGVQTGWRITVTNQNTTLSAVPILYASAAHYDIAKGGAFFDYLEFKLLAVEFANGRWLPKNSAGGAQLLDPKEVTGYMDQIGENTGYIIHPDEILASNFVPLLNGARNLPTPRILDAMERVLKTRQ
jgi:hypothetical protein